MKAFSIEFKWGIIFIVASLLWMELEKLLGWHDVYISKQPIYTNLFAIVAIAVFVLALIDKKKNYYHGTMNWTQGFLSGVIITIVVAILSPLAQWITYTYISPDYFANAITYNVLHHDQTREQAESFYNLKSYILFSALSGLSMGVITSAIVALCVRSKPSMNIK